MFFSPSQWQSRSLPKERLWNETGEFAIVGSSKKFTKSKPFLVFFDFTVRVKKPSKRTPFEWDKQICHLVSGIFVARTRRASKRMYQTTTARMYSASSLSWKYYYSLVYQHYLYHVGSSIDCRRYWPIIGWASFFFAPHQQRSVLLYMYQRARGEKKMKTPPSSHCKIWAGT